MLGELGAGILQVSIGPGLFIDQFSELAVRHGIPVTWTALVTRADKPGAALRTVERGAALPGEVYPQIACRPIVMQIGMADPIPFAEIDEWKEVLARPREERADLYRDAGLAGPGPAGDPRGLEPALAEGQRGGDRRPTGDLVGIPLDALAAERGTTPFDLLLDLALSDDMATRYRIVLENDGDDEVGDLLADKRTLLGLSDAGAHATQLCDACYSTHLLGHWVRERKALTLEDAVWRLTGHPHQAFRIRDRGLVEPGFHADLVAFDPDDGRHDAGRAGARPARRHRPPRRAQHRHRARVGQRRRGPVRRRRRPGPSRPAASSAADLRRSPHDDHRCQSPTSGCPFLDGRPKQLLIGGQWVDAASGQTFTTTNPSTGAPIAELAAGDATDADRAVAAARARVRGAVAGADHPGPAARRGVGGGRRGRGATSRSCGSSSPSTWACPSARRRPPAPSTRSSVLRYFAGWATKISGDTLPNSMPWEILTYTLREPIGVVAAIIPWNSPLNNVLWKLAPVLATGCTMVLKPAEEASLVALRIGELLTERGRARRRGQHRHRGWARPSAPP